MDDFFESTCCYQEIYPILGYTIHQCQAGDQWCLLLTIIDQWN